MSDSPIGKIDFDSNPSVLEVEAFLEHYNWISYNGIMRVKNNGKLLVYSVDIRNLYNIVARRVEAYNKDGKRVDAMRLVLHFEYREMQTAIYPTDDLLWQNILCAFIFLRDHYQNIQTTVEYSPSIFRIEPKASYDDNVYNNVDVNSPYNWSVIENE
ncbi:hypothetical protein HOU08_gp033 [Dickeya phage vB_DsoM_JA29]|uniref:Uncharacterized protein n=1 Tax=Dickeya phage vB_DsoM_JA29 TaxID=2283031 RepID=A0A384ZX06_9CAUD|nr:hypothetical protein HOU08_gp033 [Dickeya phage vB_DsoM_JA29]AXG66759.1 hypothetical protein JA29_033 [Dickeya phage vB_DsoM_JA29]